MKTENLWISVGVMERPAEETSITEDVGLDPPPPPESERVKSHPKSDLLDPAGNLRH